jgi:hypothetical protein
MLLHCCFYCIAAIAIIVCSGSGFGSMPARELNLNNATPTIREFSLAKWVNKIVLCIFEIHYMPDIVTILVFK